MPPELCPKCLLKTGLEAGPGGTVVVQQADFGSRGLPRSGEQIGNYHIVRELGRGGMGAVFEAEDLESGRRVALKVLSHALDSAAARERFFREGRLAASISHPNSVYVFGTGEIGGTPFIAMELVEGGTLNDQVHNLGPMPATAAVDAVLQMIAGLEAAHRVGILHRDIKPANCYLNPEGTVKIGDFGLSISTMIRTEPALTADGQFLGTPAFCSPEQLRGEELNLRSDMYSVGVTLYFLLTGRTPFDAQNMVQLMANVLEKQAPSPRQFQKTIPPGLANVVLRCLEKQPGNRFRSYEDLRQALAPYSSTAATPATMGLRFLAGAMDMILLAMLSVTVTLAVYGDPMEFLNRMPRLSLELLAWMAGSSGIYVLYYTIGEGIWGRTLGKAICRLRVVGQDNSPPGLARALVRSLLYVVLPGASFWIFSGGDIQAVLRESGWRHYLLQFSFYLILALMFCTVRRRNGYAAIHDLITRTRVVLRTTLLVRPMLSAAENPPAAVETSRQIGPYYVLEPLGRNDGIEWAMGYDLRLLRKVWLRISPAGSPPVPVAWRTLSRPGRLRWLAGRRTAEENWDAFEGLAGQPLLKLAQTPQPWSDVRYWLHDLAGEISAAEKDGSVSSVLALDRVWITGEGRAKLLDFPAPGVEKFHPESAAAEGISGPPIPANNFLGKVAAAALAGTAPATGVSVPLPLHARAFLEQLPKVPNPAAVKDVLKPLLSRLALVSRWRRAAVVAGCLAFPLMVAVSWTLSSSMMESWNRKNPGLMDLSQLLNLRSLVFRRASNNRGPTDRQLAIYIASHHRSLITNSSAWTGPIAMAVIKGESRTFAEQSVADHPDPTPEEIANAEQAMKPYAHPTGPPIASKRSGFQLLVADVSLVMFVGLPAIIAALLFRGGLILQIANVTFVRRDGRRASRLRTFWRALVTWSPLILTIVFCVSLAIRHPFLAQSIACGVVGGLAIISVILPNRGLADRLAGTWPVPR
jgi:uncharacterized RDD family membrane protein YckC